MGYSVQDGVPVIFDHDHRLLAVGVPEETDDVGQLRGGDLRNQHYGSSVLDEILVRDDLSRTYGDKVVVSRPRTVDGVPVGNRQERRLAERVLRRRR